MPKHLGFQGEKKIISLLDLKISNPIKFLTNLLNIIANFYFGKPFIGLSLTAKNKINKKSKNVTFIDHNEGLWDGDFPTFKK